MPDLEQRDNPYNVTQASRIYFLPNLMTAGNLFCGFVAVIKCIQARLMTDAGEYAAAHVGITALELYTQAVWCILLAVVFDSLDGRLARLGGRTSLFGAEFDSLADVVSFGVAPALMVFFLILAPREEYQWFRELGWFIAFIYLLCGAVRLARFNVITNPLLHRAEAESNKDFVGLPIPAAAGTVASLVMLLLALAERERDLRQWSVGLVQRLPVDHAVDEIDRVAVGREGHQDAAVADGLAALVDELGLEPDRRSVGDDLHIMVGQPRQQRAARNVVDRPDLVVYAAFLADRRADVGRGRAIAAAGEVEEHAVGREVDEVRGFQIFDRGIIAPVEQRHPIIVGAHVHAPLVGADRAGDGLLRDVGSIGLARRLEVARKLAITIHQERPHCSTLEKKWPTAVTKALTLFVQQVRKTGRLLLSVAAGRAAPPRTLGPRLMRHKPL